MIDRILRFIRNEHGGETLPSLLVDRYGSHASPALQRAIAIMMIGMAEADGCFTKDELQSLWDALDQHLAVRGEAASAVVSSASEDFVQKRDAGRAIALLDATLDEDQRTLVLAMSWRIARADGVEHPDEVALFQRYGIGLKLAPERVAEARALATGEKV